MGRSFFRGNDAQLYTGSKSFSTKITATPTLYGLTAPQAAAYAALDVAWEAAYLAATDPETRTKAKVQAKEDAKAALKLMASDLSKIIEGTATVTNEQKLDLGLSVRALPSPVADLGVCTNFKVTLNADGSLFLAWKCHNPPAARGTIYQVWRRIGAVGDFIYVGGAGSKDFLDSTVPAGTTAVTYQIQAVRSTAIGPWAQFNVSFGTPATSGSAKVTAGEPAPGLPRIAA